MGVAFTRGRRTGNRPAQPKSLAGTGWFPPMRSAQGGVSGRSNCLDTGTASGGIVAAGHSAPGAGAGNLPEESVPATGKTAPGLAR